MTIEECDQHIMYLYKIIKSHFPNIKEEYDKIRVYASLILTLVNEFPCDEEETAYFLLDQFSMKLHEIMIKKEDSAEITLRAFDYKERAFDYKDQILNNKSAFGIESIINSKMYH